jgi:hypothetical protein
MDHGHNRTCTKLQEISPLHGSLMDRPNATLLACQVKRKTAKIGVNRDLSSSFAPRPIRYGFSGSSLLESAPETQELLVIPCKRPQFPGSILTTKAIRSRSGWRIARGSPIHLPEAKAASSLHVSLWNFLTARVSRTYTSQLVIWLNQSSCIFARLCRLRNNV